MILQTRTSASVATVATAGTVVLAAFFYREHCRRRQLEAEAAALHEEVARQARLRDEERRGRVRAEKQLRTAIVAKENPSPANVADDDDGASVSANSDGIVFKPIGVFESCYRSRCGTPRQGGVVAESLAVLKCARDLNPVAALEGFATFSHCWVLYVFHENTNLTREGKTSAKRQGQRRGRVPLWQGLCMKVAPPRCPDKDFRVGVLACRTPHRPNPVGLSLARIVEVSPQSGEVILAGLDVVDGTPCLDLKPYLPGYESVPDAMVPDWVVASYEEPLMTVAWAPDALSMFSRILATGPDDIVEEPMVNPGTVAGVEEADAEATDKPKLSVRPYRSRMALRRALEATLALDIRSPLQRQRKPNPNDSCTNRTPSQCELEPFFTGDLWFHELHVTYSLLPLQIVLEMPSSANAARASVRIDRIERRDEAQSLPARVHMQEEQ